MWNIKEGQARRSDELAGMIQPTEVRYNLVIHEKTYYFYAALMYS